MIDQKGIDRTKEYTQGAKIALDKCLEKNIKIAVLKAKSPSCGKNHIYDGISSDYIIDLIYSLLFKKNYQELLIKKVSMNLDWDERRNESTHEKGKGE